MSSSEQDHRTLRRSSRLIAFGLAFTVVMVGIVGVMVWAAYVNARETRALTTEAEQVLHRIEFHGTSASRFRQAVVYTQEALWNEAYEEHSAALVAALHDAAGSAESDFARGAAERAIALNREIVNIERQIIQMALDGDRSEALATSNSAGFRRLVSEYTEALMQLVRASDVPQVALGLRLTLDAMMLEAERLDRAHAAGDVPPRSLRGVLQFFEKRLNDGLTSLESIAPEADGPTEVLEAFGGMLEAAGSDEVTYLEARARFSAAHAEFTGRLDDFLDERRSQQNRRDVVLPILLTLVLVLLIGAWMEIVRMVRNNFRQREHTMKALRDSQSETQALIRAIPDLIFIHDADGNIVDYHARSPELHLLPFQTIRGRNIVDLMPDGIGARIQTTIQETATRSSPRNLEFQMEVNGHDTVLDARYVPMGDGKVLGIVRDITPMWKAERARREAETRFRTLVEHSLVGIYIIQDEIVTYANPCFLEMMRGESRDIIGRSVLDLVAPDDRRTVRENLQMRIRGEGEHVHYTLRAHRLNGEEFIAEVHGSITEIDGEPAVIGTILDITLAEQSKREIAALKSFYEETLNRLPIEIAVIDTDLRYAYLNPISAPDPEVRANLIGRHVEDRDDGVSKEALRSRVEWLKKVLRTGVTSSLEESVPGDDGQVRHLVRVATPVPDEDGKLRHIVTYAMDMSERKQYELKLLDAKERAEEMSRLKTTFLANMSHEVRTPLTGIIGFATLLEEEVPPEQRQFASLIVRSGRRLLDTLNAVLDLSRLEAGEMLLEVQKLDICREVDEISSYLQPLAEEKNLEMVVETPPHPVECMVDSGALHIILNNLIGNAVKFTDEGSVEVRLSADDMRAQIDIIDTGLGIESGFLPQLFDEFKQESIGLTRSHEGAGLGLAITRRLVLLMNGAIEVQSKKGEGSMFSVSFPLAPVQLDLPLADNQRAQSLSSQTQ